MARFLIHRVRYRLARSKNVIRRQETEEEEILFFFFFSLRSQPRSIDRSKEEEGNDQPDRWPRPRFLFASWKETSPKNPTSLTRSVETNRNSMRPADKELVLYPSRKVMNRMPGIGICCFRYLIHRSFFFEYYSANYSLFQYPCTFFDIIENPYRRL